jgi:hypothetical protein
VKKTALPLVSLSAILVISAVPAFASNVVFTYTVADNGQGGWGGGPLFANGAAGGANGISFNNGADVAILKASTWHFQTTSFGTPGVDICGTLTVSKSDGFLPPPGVYTGFCLSQAIGTSVPITGGPVEIGGTIVRVTPVS